MRRIARWAIGVGSLASLGLMTAAPAQAGPKGCSLATLKGLYMFASSGWAAPTPKASLVPEGVTGMDIYHGNGKFDSLATISLGGAIFPNVTAPGRYTVNSDCTGTITIPMKGVPSVHLDIFITPDGGQYFYIQTDKGTVLTGTIQRVTP